MCTLKKRLCQTSGSIWGWEFASSCFGLVSRWRSSDKKQIEKQKYAQWKTKSIYWTLRLCWKVTLAARTGEYSTDPSGLMWDEITPTPRCTSSLRIDAETVYAAGCSVGFVEIEVYEGRPYNITVIIYRCLEICTVSTNKLLATWQNSNCHVPSPILIYSKLPAWMTDCPIGRWPFSQAIIQWICNCYFPSPLAHAEWAILMGL